MKYALLVGLMCALLGQTASAYWYASIKDQDDVYWRQRTHVLVVGYGSELGLQFVDTAIAQARRLQELEPSSQVLIIGGMEKSKSRYRSYFSGKKVNLVYIDDRILKNSQLLKVLTNFRKIASLHFFSHNAVNHGMGIEEVRESEKRFSHRLRGVADLKRRFTDDAYVFLHGCNTGFTIAPNLSKLWSVPVHGSLAATNFQELYSDNMWYIHDPGLFPSHLSLADVNRVSYLNPRGCWRGACIRLRPDPQPYTGYWGRFESGLGFFKAFCNFSGRRSESKCYKGIAHAILGHVSYNPIGFNVDYNTYKQSVVDFLCPATYKASNARCKEALRQTDNGEYTTYTALNWGNPLQCTLKGCDVSARCNTRECGVEAPRNRNPRALIQEYRLLLKAYRYL